MRTIRRRTVRHGSREPRARRGGRTQPGGGDVRNSRTSSRAAVRFILTDDVCLRAQRRVAASLCPRHGALGYAPRSLSPAAGRWGGGGGRGRRRGRAQWRQCGQSRGESGVVEELRRSFLRAPCSGGGRHGRSRHSGGRVCARTNGVISTFSGVRVCARTNGVISTCAGERRPSTRRGADEADREANE